MCRTGVEERRNEALPRNEARPGQGQAQRKLPGEVHSDCGQPDTDRSPVARQ